MREKLHNEIEDDGETCVTMADIEPVNATLAEKAAEAELSKTLETLSGLVRTGLMDEQDAIKMTGLDDDKLDAMESSDDSKKSCCSAGFGYCVLLVIVCIIAFICVFEYFFISGMLKFIFLLFDSNNFFSYKVFNLNYI
jgi:hypothetical protein